MNDLRLNSEVSSIILCAGMSCLIESCPPPPLSMTIGQFQYVTIQSETIGIISRFWGINARICMGLFPRALTWWLLFWTNFSISKLVYWKAISVSLQWGFSIRVSHHWVGGEGEGGKGGSESPYWTHWSSTRKTQLHLRNPQLVFTITISRSAEFGRFWVTKLDTHWRKM